MEPNSSNEEEGGKAAVISSNSRSPDRKMTFDTVAFSVPRKEPATFPSLQTPPIDPSTATPTVGMSKTSSMVSMLADDLQSGDTNVSAAGPSPTEFVPAISSGETGDSRVQATPYVAISVSDDEAAQFSPAPAVSTPDNPEMLKKLEQLNINESQMNPRVTEQEKPADSRKAGSGFTDGNSDFVPYTGPDPNIFPTVGSSPQKKGLKTEFCSENGSYDAWIPTEKTQKILTSVASEVATGTYVPDKEHMTMPGILLEEDLVDKVAVNIDRFFGSAEASRRKILTADNVPQDDNGLRELIKLGCYRAAINLTKRLLVLYGQGPGKVGHFSKHVPHSLQLWFTRISLLVRIREFSVAESELQAFKGFENPDMYFEYYSGSPGSTSSRKGSMVPFHFRLLAAEIPQYMRKFNETINKLYDILFRVQKIIKHLEKGLDEMGSDVPMDAGKINKALRIWRNREIKVLYSLTNSSLFAKDYYNAFNFLNHLCQKDSDHLPQLKSAMGRLFLQHGDIATAEIHFQEAADLRPPDSEPEQVDTLVDSALLSISQNNYVDAVEFLKQAYMIQPENFMITNNLAVCHLYLGNVKESLALMETTVKQNMPQSLQENVILNLCSIYELENSDGSKKLGLLKLISEYKGDGINLASLKIPDLI